MEDRTERRSVRGEEDKFWRNARRIARKEIWVAERRWEGVEDVIVSSLVKISWTITRSESTM